MTFAARTLGYSAQKLLDFEGVEVAVIDDGASSILKFETNGTWRAYYLPPVGGTTVKSGNYHLPTTAGIGSNYWVRFTRTANSIINPGTTTASTGWLSLATLTRQVTASAGGQFGSASATYLVELSTSATGTPVVDSATITLSADGTGI